MPADLHKQTSSPANNKVELWLQSHAPLFLTISFIILFILIIGLIIALATVYGASTGTEANIYYNQLESII